MPTGRRIRIRTLLTVLVFVATVPLALFGGWLVQRSGRDQRAVVDRRNVETARAIAFAVDAAIESTIEALQGLTALDLYEELAPERFSALAERVLPSHTAWHVLFVTDASGADLGATTSGFGDVAARGAWARAILEMRRSLVSNLMRDPETRAYYVSVGVPIEGASGAERVLGVHILVSQLSQLLRIQAPPRAIVTLLDGHKRIVARTRDEQRLLGALPTRRFLEASRVQAEGNWRDTLPEGVPVHGAVSRAPRSGFTVGVALPAEEVDAPIRRSLVELALVGSFVLVATTLLALALGRLMFRSFSHALEAAHALARGEPVAPRHSRVAELDELALGLGRAAVVLEGVLEKERAARAEAEAVNRSKDEFVAIVSHELRTPLSAVSGWVQLLQSGTLDPATQARALEVIARNTRLQAQLIEDLLDLSRMVTGTLRLDVRPVELAAVVTSAVDAVRHEAERKEIELSVTCAPGLGLVNGDPDRLQQIVSNLLSNAIKFTPGGGRVSVTLAGEGRELVLRVRDTGAGIAADVLPHVFERFRQGVSSASRSQGGLGIGLALVQHLVELHGGQVEAESTGAGHGALFTVRLPVCPQPAAAHEPSYVAPPPTATPVLTGTRVLVVDDDDDARELVGAVLARAGAAVATSASAAEALEQVAQASPDVLVSDVAMPVTTGHDLIATLRRAHAALPAIALSAYGRTEDRERALRAGFDLHLVKPVDAWVLVQAVGTLAARRRADLMPASPPSPASP